MKNMSENWKLEAKLKPNLFFQLGLFKTSLPIPISLIVFEDWRIVLDPQIQKLPTLTRMED